MTPTDPRSDDELAKILWDYNCMETPLHRCDAILALGSHDVRVAERAAELYLQGYAAWLIFSGGYGALTQGIFQQPEAQVFAETARRMGVPGAAMLIEDQSSNTGENIRFTKNLVEQNGLSVHTLILVQKPYMLRRAYATLRMHWHGLQVAVCGPQIGYDEYPNQQISRQQMINIIVGDTQRIRIYPALGYQIDQDMPDEVWSACQELIRRGYTQRLVDMPALPGDR